MTTNIPRIGFHYFPDTAHYRQMDLDTWLPELQRLGASSVTLLAPPERAIPESFIAGLLSAGIEPILHFPFHCQAQAAPRTVDALAGLTGRAAVVTAVPGCLPLLTAPPPPDTLRLLLNAYGRWGVRKAVFFDRPNLRALWSSAAWLQGDLVERFLDLYLPVAMLAFEAGLAPVFPPLAPGGDYWDLSFLRSALRGLKRRSAGALLEKLILSAEAFLGDHPLEWGVGGPERWPSTRPYHIAPGQQDHLGFHIFDWYLAVARQELGAPLPIVLLRAGQRNTGVTSAPGALSVEASASHPAANPQERIGPSPIDVPAPTGGVQLAAGIAHARQNLAVAEALAAAPEDGGLPEEVLAGHFWLLSAAPRTAAGPESWFPPAGSLLPVVSVFQAWAAHRLGLQPVAPAKPAPAKPAPAKPAPAKPGPTDPELEGTPASPASNEEAPVGNAVEAPQPQAASDHNAAPARSPDEAIDHYILLPLYAWGAADWDLALVQPLIQQGHPTIGFSLAEARLARRVTVVGGPGAVSAEALEMLRRNGCQVERLLEDGTLIASNWS